MRTEIVPIRPTHSMIAAPATNAMGTTRRVTVDLRDVIDADLSIIVAKGGTTQPGVAPAVRVRALYGDGAQAAMGGSIYPIISPTPVITGTIGEATVNINSPAGSYTLFASTTANFGIGDLIAIASKDLTAFEVHRVAATVASGLWLDSPLVGTFLAAGSADIRSKAEQWMCRVEGGSVYEVVIDQAATATGSPVLSAVWGVLRTGAKRVRYSS